MLICGVDASTSRTGLCLIDTDKTEPLFLSSFVPVSTTQDAKLKEIADWVKAMSTGASLVVYEEPFGVIGNGKILLILEGFIRCTLYPTELLLVPQTTLKKFSTGSGRAEKGQIMVRLLKEFGIEAKTDDDADAYFLALVGKVFKGIGEHPQFRKDALVKLIEKSKPKEPKPRKVKKDKSTKGFVPTTIS